MRGAASSTWTSRAPGSRPRRLLRLRRRAPSASPPRRCRRSRRAPSPTSGYRPPAYNAAVGGAADSLHLDGLAADVVSEHVPFAVLTETADRLIGEAGGVGTYWGQSFVHVDLRGEYAR